MPRIEHWTLVNADGTTADRFDLHAAQTLRGHVYGHPRHPDGKPVRTSAIVAASRNTLTTQSGQAYDLGQVDPGYVTWLGVRPLPLGAALTPVPLADTSGALVRA